MGFVKAFAMILLLGGLLYWGLHAMPPIPTSIFAESPEAGVASPLPAVESGRTTIEGVIIYTETDPPVPFIQYTYREGEIRTKQLILRTERGCDPAQGDLPCPFGSQTDSYPYPPYGQKVRVTGVLNSDQILVEEIEYR
jgi:hypothetical protein